MTERIKLLIAIPNFYGGTGTFCRNLASGLKKNYGAKYHISLICFDNQDFTKEDYSLFDYVRIIGKRGNKDIRRFYEFPYFYYKVGKEIKELNPEIVFSIGTYMNVLMSLLLSRETKIILSEHDVPSIRTKFSRYGKIINYFIMRNYYDKLCIGISKGVIDDLANNYKLKRLKLIYYGIDIKLIQKLSLSENISDIPDFPYIISVGRLNVQKDFKTLIYAYNYAINKGLDIDLVIVGEGEEEARLRELIKNLNLEKRIHLLGYKKNPYPYIRNAKLFVLSSIWEGFGYVLLEAMALGVPVISTDCKSGPAEILNYGEYGKLVSVGNFEELGEAIYSTYYNKERLKEFSLKSVERSKFFSIDRMITEYDKLFEEVKNEKR